MFNTNIYIFLQLYILGAVNSTVFLKVVPLAKLLAFQQGTLFTHTLQKKN